MKKMKYILSLMLVLVLASCKEGTDFDIEYTPLAPIGGQYVVTVSYGIDETKTDAEFWASPSNVTEVGQMYATLSNTTAMDTDKAWIRVGSYSAKNMYNVNAKVGIDMSTYKFEGVGVDDFVGNSATPVDKATISGYCTHNDYKAPSGTVTDYICVIYSRSDYPGYHFKAEGWKYTGWAEDDY